MAMSEFLPHLEILPPAQRRLWVELAQVPKDFVLYGGTALALHLGHRESADFGFFGRRALEPFGRLAAACQAWPPQGSATGNVDRAHRLSAQEKPAPHGNG